MKYIVSILFLIAVSSTTLPLLLAQNMPISVSAAMYQLTNEGVDTIVVYMPSFNDQLSSEGRNLLPFFAFWQKDGRHYSQKYDKASPLGQALMIEHSNITNYACEHFYEIENEEVLEPYYRQLQDGDTVWIMFPPKNSLKDLFIIQFDGLNIEKLIDIYAIDAKEYISTDIYNIHYTVNAGLYTSILRKSIQKEVYELENKRNYSPK